tara:strand:+ start:3158 stop:3865 length:708 start_codon:yes stop_codon:yes gene_type:complete
MRPKKKRKSKSKKPSFEESIHLVDEEIRKRRNKWNLTALAWMDYEDVSQIIRVHIYKKWDMYDPAKPLGPWLNRIISNQIKNLIRNHYGNYSRPCLKCAAAEGENLCEIYSKQCSDCPLYADWEKNKKRAYDIKIPLSIENHQNEVKMLEQGEFNIETNAKKLHEKMQTILKPLEWKMYNYLYIENKSEKEVAKLMGYRTSEKNRSPGYKQIKNIKKSILIKVKKVLDKHEIDFF